MSQRRKVSVMRKTFLFFLLIALGTISLHAANDEEKPLRINSDYTIRKSSENVTVYYTNEKGEKVEYLFEEFNADVVLYVYKRIDRNRMINLLADKYRLSKTESRRRLKMAINTMEVWSIVERI